MYNPMSGVVTSEFSRNRKHPVTGKNLPHWGIDIASRGDRRIRAAYTGIVEIVGYNKIPHRSGQHIFIRNPDGEGQVYGHISKAYTNTGDRVSEGQVIADEGSTGHVTGAHLHFETHKRGSGPSNGYSLVRNPRTDFNAAGITPGVNTTTSSTPSVSRGETVAQATAKQVNAVYVRQREYKDLLLGKINTQGTANQVNAVYVRQREYQNALVSRFDAMEQRLRLQGTAHQVNAVYTRQREYHDEILKALDIIYQKVSSP